MHPRIKRVVPKENFTLLLTFDNDEEKLFDTRPYLNSGIFRELKNTDYFQQVKPCMGTIAWPHGQDFCPDTLFEESVPAPH